MKWFKKLIIVAFKNLLAIAFISLVVVGFIAIYDAKLVANYGWFNISLSISMLYLFICLSDLKGENVSGCVTGGDMGTDGGDC